MKRFFTLLAFTTIFAISACSQPEQDGMPKNVAYQPADDSTNAKAVAAIREALGTGEPSALFDGSVTCGPLLWSRYKDLPEGRVIIKGADTTFKVPQYNDKGRISGRTEVNGKLIKDEESFTTLWFLLRKDVKAGDKKKPDPQIVKDSLAWIPGNELLREFKQVSDEMRAHEAAIDRKNNATMHAFEEAYNDDPAHNSALMKDAKRAMEMAEEFVKEVEEIRKLIIHESGGYLDDDTMRQDLVGKRDLETPTKIMVEEGKGTELKNSIQALRDSLLALPMLNDSDRIMLSNQFTLSTYYNIADAQRLGKKSWEEYLFYRVPVIAVTTILFKFQGDAKNSAGLVVETVLKKVGTPTFVNKLTIRKLNPEELSYFAAISSPKKKHVIKEPLYLIDTAYFDLLLQLSGDMKVRWIEMMP